MRLIPEKTASLKPYGFEDADGVRIKADANESFVPLPARLREKLAAIALEAPYNRYPDPLATRALNAYSTYIGVPAENITAGNGSDELISLIENSLLSRGDRLLVTEPDFSMYRFYAGLAEVVCASAPKTELFRVSPETLLKEIARVKPAAVMFSNPCSPTGLGLGRDEILKLVDASDVLWIIDEAYMDFWDQSIASEAVSRSNVIVLRTCSKAFGLAALRLGFAIACDELTAALRKAKSPANVNYLTCEMAAAVISDREYIQGARDAIRSSANWLNMLLAEAALHRQGIARVLPSLANLSFITFVKPGMARSLQEYLRKKGILVRCLGESVRITACQPEENKEIAAAFAEWLEVN